MKCVTWSLLVAGLAVAAHADVNLFFKDYGLSDFVDAGGEMDFLPYFEPGYSPVADCAVDTGVGSGSQWFFLWGEFVGEAPYTRIISMQTAVILDDSSGAIGSQGRQKRHANAQWDRWQNSAPIPLDGGTAQASGADGIAYMQPGDVSYDLFDVDSGQFLLGTIEVWWQAEAYGRLEIALGDAGLVALDGATGESFQPAVNCYGIDFVPEPATLVLALAIGAFLRRGR